MTQTRRTRLHDATRAEIKQIAQQHMAAEGTAAISLRAIARDMGISATALYRYFPSLDDLITALIVDAYEALGDALEAADASTARNEYAARFSAVALAYRAWAVAHPAQFSLIFGSPIPGYHAPADITRPIVQRALRPFGQALQEAWLADALAVPPPSPHSSPELQQQLRDWAANQELTVPVQIAHAMLLGWNQIQGMVLMELFGHLPLMIGDPEPLYRAEVQAFLARLGMAA